jgi:hypothetical protein
MTKKGEGRPTDLLCSFCGKSQDEVKKINRRSFGIYL